MSTTGPLLIAVGGGKGGVGKSVVALNLAYALAKLGSRVVMVDADLGAANLHSMCGIDQPGGTLQAFVDRRVSSLEEVVLPTRYRGLSLLPGSGAVFGAANIAHAQKAKIIRHIRQLDADVIVIDVGAGVSFNVIDFFSVADIQLIVASPQLTSLQNAYSFLKGTVFRHFNELAKDMGQTELLAASTTRGETERVAELIARVALDGPELAAAMRRSLQRRIGIIGNQLEQPGQINVLHALSRMVRDFLGADIPVLGGLCVNARIHRSVTKRVPFLHEAPIDAEVNTLHRLAERVLEIGAEAPRSIEAEAEAEPAMAATAAPLPPTLDKPVPRFRRTPIPIAAPAAAQETPASIELPPTRGLGGQLHHYLRKDERYGVTWSAIIRVGFDTQAVKVLDISLGGASLMMRNPASALDQLVVVFDGVPGRPEFQCRVRHVEAMTGRCGVEFYGESARTKAQELVELAIQQGGRNVTNGRTHAA